MIKFFRKIRQQLLSQNKFNKYFLYAIGEIVLVVLGILIALQINNWNQERNNVKKEIIYLTNLVDELNTNDSLSSGYIDFSRGQYEAADYLANSMTSNNHNAEVVTFIDALFRCFYVIHVSYSNNVWEELKSTGDLSLIKNKEVVKSISNYIKLLEWAVFLEKEFSLKHIDYRSLTNEIIDFETKKKIVDIKLKNRGLSNSRLRESEVLVSEIQMKTMIAELKELKGLSGLLSDIYLNKKVAEINYQDIVVETNKLRTMIKNEIELLKK